MRCSRCILILTGCIFFCYAQAQRLTSPELIDAWSVSDTSQTSKAEATYSDLHFHIDSATFYSRLVELNDYLARHPSKRLEARIIMYRVKGEDNLSKLMTMQDTRQIKHAIILAGLLKDEQLLSELYYLYAEYGIYAEYGDNDIEDKLFYELKSIDIQRRIGFRHFSLAHMRFLQVSQLLYAVRNYRASIQYGLQGLALLESPKNSLSDYILELDDIGASYRILGMADSTIFYYKKIRRILDSFTHDARDYAFLFKYDKFFNRLDTSAYVNTWMGISAGGIGQGLFLQKKYAGAYVLLLQNVSSSISYKQYGDAALAENTLAQIDFIRHDYAGALSRWKQAYAWAAHDNELESMMNALYGIAGTYKLLGNYDSAYIYIDKYHIYNDTLQVLISKSRLATVNTRLKFDGLQATLRDAQARIDRQALFRNYTLAAVILLAVISILLYNRHRLRQNLRNERIIKEKEVAEIKVALVNQQVADAQRQLDDFKRSIIEKNKLIAALEEQFSISGSDEAGEALRNFTILTKDDWHRFREAFEKAYPSFWLRLDRKMPGLTQSELRFMALTRLGMDNREMSAIMGISPDSVRSIIHRIRKKFDFPDADGIRTAARDI